MQHEPVFLEQMEPVQMMPDRGRAMTALLRLFSESRSRKEYLDGVVKLFQEWTGCRYVGIRVLDPEGNVPYESYSGYSREFWESENRISVNSDQCICTRVIRGVSEPQDAIAKTPFGSFSCGNTMEFISRLSPDQRARFRGVCMRVGFTSLAVVPVTYRGRILGAVHLADEREGRLPREVIELVETMAPLAGEAVQRFGLEDELRRNNDIQSAINSLLRLSLEDVPLQQILERAQGLLFSLPWLSLEPNGFIKLADCEDELPPVPGYCQVPIRSEGGMLGYIALKQREDGQHRRDEENALVAIAGVVAGIIMRKRMEERLLRAQRLEMAGRVAGQVAHDLNNLLTPLVGYPQLIKRHLPPDHPVVKYCDAQIKIAQQILTINEDLLTLGRRGRLRQQPSDLNYLVGLALSQAEELPPTVTLTLDLSIDLPQISAAPSQLLRVISNLVANAREAMDGAGGLSVRTELVQLHRPVGQYRQVKPGQYVRLLVSDTGCGIPPSIINRVFDPFFSTKETDRKSGSGLGLSIVQAVVEDHGGYVDVQSKEGEGTAFSIYLPAPEPTT